MPRPERPLDDQPDDLAAFAAGLRALREQAGRPGYRALATQAHYSATTLAEAAGGRALPSLAVTLAYVRACGGDAADWEQRWHAIAAGTTSGSPDTGGRAPYVGLAVFEPADAERFFGREALTDDLVRRVREHRFVAVFGASGAGKSSVLRAGLIARMRESVGQVALLVPGPHPVEECAVAMAMLTGRPARALRDELAASPDALHRHVCQAMADRPADTDLVLVVDQFEEVFTLCRDMGERHAFITALVRASGRPGSRLRVVLGVRTDFYTHCSSVPELVDALRDSQVLVGPMTPDELRSAIVQPAVRTGCTVEGALLATMIADCAGEAAVLPLLSHALLETWRRRRGAMLALTGYQAAGGIAHAIAHTAEQTYARFDAAQRRLVRALFLRLIALGDATEDTRRRIRRAELDPDTIAIVEELAQARLVTVDHDRIEITHEALIRCWPRLRDWLATDREALRIHRQITDATTAWLAAGRDPYTLFRGSRLAAARVWRSASDAVVTRAEDEFLTAGFAAQTHDHVIARRRTRRVRQLVALLGVLVIAATVATVTTVRSQETAAQQRELALVRNVLDEAAALRPTDPDLALRLSLAAYRITPGEDTGSAVLDALAVPQAEQLVALPRMDAAAFSPDGRLMVGTYEDDTARIWDLTRPAHVTPVATLHGVPSPVSAFFSPDGHLLTLAGQENSQLWDVTTPHNPRLLSTSGAAAVVDADDHLLATAGRGDVQLWDSTDPRQPAHLATPPVDNGTPPFNSDGHTLAVLASSTPSTVQLWNITNPRQPTAAGPIVMSGAIHTLNHSPTAPILAVGTDTGTTGLWDVSDPSRPHEIGRLDQAGAIMAVAFSADGRTLATTALKGSIVLWNIESPTDPRQVFTVTPPAPVLAMGFGPAGLFVTGFDNTVRLIDLSQLGLAEQTQDVTAAVASADGNTLVTTESPDNATAARTQVWDLANPNRPTPAATLPVPVTTEEFVPDGGTALNRNGSMLATNDRGRTRLWNISDRDHPTELATVPLGYPAAFSPDGKVLATVAANDGGRLWDLSRPNQPRLVRDLGSTLTTASVAISPRGHLMATAPADGLIHLWDTTNNQQPRMIGSPPTVTGMTTLTFGPDGRTLVAGGLDSFIEIWNITDPANPTKFATLRGVDDQGNPVAFSPDGRTLATPGPNHTVRLWDITDPANPTLKAELADASRPVAFRPDRHTLIVIASNKTIQLRETDIGDATAGICASTAPTLTRTEWNQYLPNRPYQALCP